MTTATALFSISLLFVIFYQDYKYRAYYWVIALFLAISFIIYNLLSVTFQVFINNLTINISILLLQFVLVALMLSLKEKKLVVNFTQKYMGVGDIILFLNLCLLFSTLNFIFFMLSSLFLICLGVILFRIFKIKFKDELPFGGLQSLCLIAVLTCSFLFESFRVNDDSWILNLMGYE